MRVRDVPETINIEAGFRKTLAHAIYRTALFFPIFLLLSSIVKNYAGLYFDIELIDIRTLSTFSYNLNLIKDQTNAVFSNTFRITFEFLLIYDVIILLALALLLMASRAGRQNLLDNFRQFRRKPLIMISFLVMVGPFMVPHILVPYDSPKARMLVMHGFGSALANFLHWAMVFVLVRACVMRSARTDGARPA